MGEEPLRYSDEFLNILAYFCETEIDVCIYLPEKKNIYGKITAMTADYVELSSVEYEYIIPMRNIVYVTTEKGRKNSG